ncbi:MAG: beta-propeller domain-containing protein [Burkholderiaceae bacterium]
MTPFLATVGRRLALPVLLAAMAACGGGDTPAEAPRLQPKGTLSVVGFAGGDACAALEAHIEDTALAMLREQLDGLSRMRFAEAGGGAVSAPVSAPAADAAAGPAASFSQTNVRIAGIDEPDPVKTDGRRLFTLRRDVDGLTLSELLVAPSAALTVLGQTRWPADTPLAGTGHLVAPESARGLMLVAPDALLALSTSDQIYAYPQPLGGATGASADSAVLCVDAGCGPGFSGWAPPRTRLRLFDVAADGAPAEQWLLDVPGSLLAARRIGAMVYLVTQSALQLPVGVRSYPDVDPSRVAPGSPAWNDAVAATMAENERLVRARSLSDWLADMTAFERTGGAGSAQAIDGAAPTADQCARFARVDTATRLAWLRISTIDLDTRSASSRTLLAEAQGVLMTERSLTVFTPYWRQGDELSSPRNLTILHRFKRDGAGALDYDASGAFDGRLINDYAIDEHADGTLRVAATDWDKGSYSYLATLRAKDGRFETVGRSDSIAPGETLQSARFIGDRAYLVTFRQIDPFFVYDLSDASAPRRLGELKLPGFSTYLHPLDDGHLLGIGFDGDGRWPRRLKATLFDVSDPADPRERLSLPLGDSYTDSDATWDPHAFTFYRPVAGADPAIVAIPVRSYLSSWYGTSALSGIRLLSIDPSDPVTPMAPLGTLSMTDLLPGASSYAGWRSMDARRAVFIDDTVYAVSDGAVRAATIADPATSLGTIAIP